MFRIILTLFVIIFLTNISSAQLKIVNPNDYTVSLAIGHYVDKGIFKGWNTAGWINIAPHDSVNTLENGIVGNLFCLYGRLNGCDQIIEGQYGLYIHPSEAFKISNASTDSPISLNKGISKAAFIKVEVPKGQNSFRYVLPLYNCTSGGIREGSWSIYLDRDKEEISNPLDATYLRKITYKDGKPTGIVRDYFKNSNQIQWDGKLLQSNPDIKHGTCITYDESGRKREEVNFQNGQIIGSIRKWDSEGREIITKKIYKTVSILPTQIGYLFSYYNTGKSRAVVPVTLPSNTVMWFYEFTASRKEEEVIAARKSFNLLSDLTQMVDETGLAKLAVSSLTAPPGGNVCNVYLITNPKQSDLFEAKKEFIYNREGTRNNLTSALVPIKENYSKQVYLGLNNPDSSYGIHYAIEVVAIVEDTE